MRGEETERGLSLVSRSSPALGLVSFGFVEIGTVNQTPGFQYQTTSE